MNLNDFIDLLKNNKTLVQSHIEKDSRKNISKNTLLLSNIGYTSVAYCSGGEFSSGMSITDYNSSVNSVFDFIDYILDLLSIKNKTLVFDYRIIFESLTLEENEDSGYYGECSIRVRHSISIENLFNKLKELNLI